MDASEDSKYPVVNYPDVKYLSAKEMESLMDKKLLSKKTVEKAARLFLRKKVCLEKAAGSSIYFKVDSREEHEIIYRRRSGKWLCDCQYFSLYPKKFCSHILSVHILLDSAPELTEQLKD